MNKILERWLTFLSIMLLIYYLPVIIEENIVEPQIEHLKITNTNTLVKKESKDQETKDLQEESRTKKDSALPDAKHSDWNLVLVGPHNKIEQEITEENLRVLDNGYQVDKRIEQQVEDLQEAADKAGFPLVMISAFRSVQLQKEVFFDNVELLISRGHTYDEAVALTKKTITEPGFSEHHTGLAIDVVDESRKNNYENMLLDESFGDEPGAKWLAKHARDYGFIVRYPKDKQNITSITYEPWHLRYVGVENAKYIEEHQLTLEEYLDLLDEK